MVPSFRPVDVAALDDSTQQSTISSLQDETTRGSAVSDKSDSENDEPSGESTPDKRKPSVPVVKDKKEATEIFKELLREKVSCPRLFCRRIF